MDPTQRFSSRVDNYVRYRPRYPEAILETLRTDCGFTPESVVADIGSGTGFLTELFLQNGNTVYGVEPNPDMRAAGERLLQSYPGFHSVDARAEATTLPDHSFDLVVAGQAFHWFAPEKTKVEFARIMQPEGWVALVWNGRETSGSPFLVAYEQLLRTYGTDYEQVRHKGTEENVLAAFFGPGALQKRIFDNQQTFDYEGLEGRLRSSSFTPEPGDPRFAPMLDALRDLFDRYQTEGKVTFVYRTVLYYGQPQKSTGDFP